jgi:hypothetical protein
LADQTFKPADDHELLLGTEEQSSGSRVFKLGAIVFALTLTGALLLGYLYLQRLQRERLARQQAARPAPENLTPRAQVFQDEVRLKSGKALVTGTVRNISGEPLEALTVEIELKRRVSQALEIRPVKVEPGSLKPGESGKYSLQIPAGEWAGVRVVKLRGGAGGAELGFKPEMGERRPAESPPPGKTIVVQRPKKKGDEFLNTPDTAIRVP